MSKLYGGIEAGGTKFVCAVGTNPEDLTEIRFETTTPDETISQVAAFFKKYHSKKHLSAIGIGSFGPIDMIVNSPAYGHITSTPKKDWANTNIVGMIKKELDIPVALNTDVNAAAFGEFHWGAAQGLSDFIYLTIGTGIGGGGMVNGGLMGGMVHPEMGHIFIPQLAEDSYEGKCPFHKNQCFEGLASGPAIEARWEKSAMLLGTDHQAWEFEAHYISLALANYICILSPKRIILGGGVMEQKQLLQKIHKNVKEILNNYIQADKIIKHIEEYIVLPSLGNRAGVLGALSLAKTAVQI